MSWAGRRQFVYSMGFLLFVAGILFLIFYSVFFQKPTCMDGKQNGGEQGIDCGGNCVLFCPFQVSEPNILWSRVFPVSGSNYNLVAYVENQNINAGVYDIGYEFRVYDTAGKYIGRREGRTFIPPNQRFAVFESRFDAGESVPKNSTFIFTEAYIWIKREPVSSLLSLSVDKIVLDNSSGSPRLTARIKNNSIIETPQFDVITILYNESRNAISASKTHLDGLKSNESSPLIFTWPVLFAEDPSIKDIIPLINPFLIKS